MYKNNVDWNLYNQQLVNRGRVVKVLIEPSLVKSKPLKNLNRDKFGRPYLFNPALISAAMTVKCALRLGYRQLEGFMKDVCKRLRTKIPNFRTIWWRFCKSGCEVIEPLTSKNRRAIIAIDSTGLRKVNDGEYRAMKYDKRREWVKLHAAFNVETGEFVNVAVTNGHVNDSPQFKRLIKPILRSTSMVLADKGYDSVKAFELCRKGKIIANIPVKLNATNSSSRSRARRDAIVEQLGFEIRPGSNKLNRHLTEEDKIENQEAWKQRSGYRKRVLIESSFSRYKRVLGESLFSRNRHNVKKEVIVKINLLNLLTRLN